MVTDPLQSQSSQALPRKRYTGNMPWPLATRLEKAAKERGEKQINNTINDAVEFYLNALDKGEI